MKTIKVNSWEDVPENVPVNFTGIIKYSNGDIDREWLKEDKYHRADGPAIEFRDGTREWRLEARKYYQIVLKNFIVLDHYKGKHGIMWYKLLDKDKIFEYPDIPGLIIKY